MTDREWEYLKRLIPAAKTGGRKRQTDMRLTVNAIFYINRTASQWRYAPDKDMGSIFGGSALEPVYDI
jgi:putative transposase